MNSIIFYETICEANYIYLKNIYIYVNKKKNKTIDECMAIVRYFGRFGDLYNCHAWWEGGSKRNVPLCARVEISEMTNAPVSRPQYYASDISRYLSRESYTISTYVKHISAILQHEN